MEFGGPSNFENAKTAGPPTIVLRRWWFLHWARGLESWVRSQSPQLMEDFEWKNLLETYRNEWFRGIPRLGNLYLLTWHSAIFFQVIRRLWRYRDDLCIYFSMPIHQRFEEGPEVDFCDGLLMFTCLKVRWWSLVGGDWNHGILWLSRNNWECRHPNWRTHSIIFQRGRYTTNQIPIDTMNQ